MGSVPSVANLTLLFGTVKAKHSHGNATGSWDHVPECLPPNWHNCKTLYTLAAITTKTVKQFVAAPKVFGRNHGLGHLKTIDTPLNKVGTHTTLAEVACRIYKAFLATNVPGMPNITDNIIKYIAVRLNLLFNSFGCKMVDL